MRPRPGLAVAVVTALALASAGVAAAGVWTPAFDVGPVHAPVPWSPGMFEWYPEVHVATAGDLAAFAWTDLDGMGRRLRARTRSASTGAFGPILDVAAGDARLGSATVTVASDGDGVFIWAIRGESIQARQLVDGRLGPVVELARGHVTGASSVAVDAAGDAVVAWEGVDKRVRLRTLSAAGVAGPVVTVATPDLRVGYASVAVAASGRAIVVWDNADRNRRRLRARTASTSGRIGPIVDLWRGHRPRPRDRAIDPTVALADDGAALVAWRLSPSVPDKPFDRAQARFLSAAGRLGPTMTFPHRGADPGYGVALSPGGRGVVAWRQGAGKRLVRAALLSRGGHRGPAVEVSDAPPFPRLSIDGGGRAVFAGATDDGVYARSLSPDDGLGPVEAIAAPGELADGDHGDHVLAAAAGEHAVVAWQHQGASGIRGAIEP